LLAGETESYLAGLTFRGTVFPLEIGSSDKEDWEIDQLIKQSKKF